MRLCNTFHETGRGQGRERKGGKKSENKGKKYILETSIVKHSPRKNNGWLNEVKIWIKMKEGRKSYVKGRGVKGSKKG